jgi:hypothetical protein
MVFLLFYPFRAYGYIYCAKRFLQSLIPVINNAATEEGKGNMNEEISSMGEGQGNTDVLDQIEENG